MEERELWLTAQFNEQLSGFANAILGIFNIHARDPQHPWENWIVMEILCVLLIMALVAAVRGSFSADKPGKVQHMFEVLYEFLKTSAEDSGIHFPSKYLPFFGTIFIFILVMNLIGLVPAFESPTMTPAVPAGLAICAFAYYNALSVKSLGLGKYLAHFAGDVIWMAPLMIPIEIVSHLARPLSLTIRLFANMFAGEQVTGAFLGLTYLVVPAVFMALHVFVAFLQAYIFTLLTMIYVGMGTAHEEH